ncbi:riboflavin synthase [Virgibacillus phasianinus]|uniref:Riboflavin synthase n=1 Tax=Virgibacillus phasianinus TaxID=2017483 RepID=A0A220TZR3_9BACI|nr:riboflavin synthase [Virgibacillus phasianinus]ASK61123.1 riboflavin synthase [Virgibacillus phasianinus]
MFTGIVEEKGKLINSKRESANSIQLTIQANTITSDLTIGDSIAVNGICLTVTTFSKDSFRVDVMPETIKATSLRSLTTGSPVNLERAMPANGRFGGHFVSGHIDGTGKITRKEKQENAIYYDIEVSRELQSYLLKKGSIAVDGISLTVFDVNNHTFTISLIPHTVSQTVLGEKTVGDIVNIECDMLAKYIEQMMQRTNTKHKGINQAFLSENGYF